MSTTTAQRPSRASLQLTEAQINDPVALNAAAHTFHKLGIFPSVSEAQEWCGTRAAALRGEPVGADYTANLTKGAKVAAIVAEHEKEERAAWDLQSRRNNIVEQLAAVRRRRTIEAGKIAFVLEDLETLKVGYFANVGVAEVSAASLRNFGSALLGAKCAAAFIQSDVLATLDAEAESLQEQLDELK